MNDEYKNDAFFRIMERQCLALTFDDVRLIPNKSTDDYHSSDLTTRFSRNVSLKTPVASAAMDRVTEKDMAIALASCGGIGVIHRNLDPEDQSLHVRAVKHYLNGRIDEPVTVLETSTIEQVLNMCRERQFNFRSFPVLDDSGRLIGMLTGNDIDFCSSNMNAKVRDVMSKNPVTAESSLDHKKAYKRMAGEKVKSLPLVNAEGEVTGLYIWSDVQRLMQDNSLQNTDSNGRLMVAAAVGTGEEALERSELLVRRGVDAIVIDSAHGDSQPVYDTLAQIKKDYPDVDVVAGNISQYDSATRLVEAGADGIKVGQGGGSICTTRIVAGIGTPQVTATYNCKRAVRESGLNIPVCSDGGIRHPGDISIAIAAGADSVMVGMLLAGTDEAPGDTVMRSGVTLKSYRGMGSLGAMETNEGSKQRYGERQKDKDMILPEGVEAYVPYSGPLKNIVHRNMEGLRRGMGYVGVNNILSMQSETTFSRITNSGLTESYPHDVNPDR